MGGIATASHDILSVARARLFVTVVVATMLVACGGSAGTPTPAPTDTLAASPAAASAGAFAIAGLTANILPGGPPDPSTFATSFTTNIPSDGDVLARVAIYIVYKLAPGLAGKVRTVTTSPDGETIADSFDYLASTDSAHFTVTYVEGFAPGDHEVVLTFEPTGESLRLPFTITEPGGTTTAIPDPTVDPAGFPRIDLNEFVPDLLHDYPISLEIPGDFARFGIENRSRSIWMRPAQGQEPTFPTEFDKPDSAFFVVGLSLNTGYDAATDRFTDESDSLEEVQAALDAQGLDITVRRYERKDLRDFPVLLLESESPYGGPTRTVVTIYLATTVETNTLLIQFYFATGPETPVDRAIWERFESSLRQTR